jgi:uncharacterized protein (DUF427 family)
VWDYPRPPLLEPTPRRIRVVLGGEVVADTTRAWRVCETSHPPSYYVPREDCAPGALVPAAGSSVCEWKGPAAYLTVRAGGRVAERAAWTYPDPSPRFAPIAGHVAFYPALMDECWVGDVRAAPQEGGFYGGWVTPDVVGPFKGGPGTWGW